MKLQIQKKQLSTAIALALTLTIAVPLISAPAFAQAKRKCTAYISVNPHLLGLGQQMTINGWVLPARSSAEFTYLLYEGLVVTFTRPDGTTDVFANMTSDWIGGVLVTYVPDKLGNWSVTLFSPGDGLYEATQNI